MKKALFTLLVVFQINAVFGQRINEFGLELGYPVQIGKVFFSNPSNVGFDIGLQYNFFEKKNFILGLTGNLTKFFNPEIDVVTSKWIPQVEAGYKVVLDKFTITPKLSVGYCYEVFDYEFPQYSEWYSNPFYEDMEEFISRGVSSNVGLAISRPIGSNLTFNVQCDYQFMRLKSVDRRGGDSWHNSNTLLPRIGVSYTLAKK